MENRPKNRILNVLRSGIISAPLAKPTFNIANTIKQSDKMAKTTFINGENR